MDLIACPVRWPKLQNYGHGALMDDSFSMERALLTTYRKLVLIDSRVNNYLYTYVLPQESRSGPDPDV